MEDINRKPEILETPDIIVCDLDTLDWLELEDGTIMVDYRYVTQLQGKCGG